MKKILTLLLVAGAFTAQAQTSREEARKVILGGGNRDRSNEDRDVRTGSDRGYPGSYPTTETERAEVERINREYDTKIESIRNNPNLSAEEKRRTIRQLEEDRHRRLREIKRAYKGDRKRSHHDDDDRDDDRVRDRHDNGKHKGWEKGKGNPHRNGGKNWKKDRR